METARRRRRDRDTLPDAIDNSSMTTTGHHSASSLENLAHEPADEEIARRAYQLYELRGREDGHDWDDWIQAEHELRDSASREHGPHAAVEHESRYAAV